MMRAQESISVTIKNEARSASAFVCVQDQIRPGQGFPRKIDAPEMNTAIFEWWQIVWRRGETQTGHSLQTSACAFA